MSIANELKASLLEAIEIKQERKIAARVTRYELADIKLIRAGLSVTQQEFAQALGIMLILSKAGKMDGETPQGLLLKCWQLFRITPRCTVRLPRIDGSR